MTETTRLDCRCGRVHLELRGAPILSTECCCNSCREAAERLRKLPGAPMLVTAHGATHFVLYRKDRVHLEDPGSVLKELRLTPQSKTRRVVATCCNTPLFLEFENGHWLSLYACLWPEGSRPAPELRTMTSDLPAGSPLPADIPNAKTQSFSFFAKLLGAWIAMGFRAPKVAIAPGALTV
nr:MAG: hypothetical protein DIU78_05535 [Pseudomonadota bacterium]